MIRATWFLLAAVVLGVGGEARAAQKKDEDKPLANRGRARSLPLDKLYDRAVLAFERDGDKLELPYRLYLPGGEKEFRKKAKSGKARYALIVFLHGLGECGADNGKQLKNGVAEMTEYVIRKKEKAVLVAPQIDGKTFSNWGQPQSLAAVEKLIETLYEKYPLDPDRLYITGLSLGGMGTWAFVGHRPDLVAAAIPVCGSGWPGAARREDRPREMKDVSIWAFHGAADPTVDVSGSRDMVRALRAVDGAVYYSEWPRGKHNIWDDVYSRSAVWDWLFDQVRGRKPVPPKNDRNDRKDEVVALDDEIPG